MLSICDCLVIFVSDDFIGSSQTVNILVRVDLRLYSCREGGSVVVSVDRMCGQIATAE